MSKSFWALAVLLLGLTLAPHSDAYSYAAAGKEPLIEGREKIINAVAANDYAAVAAAVTQLKPEFDYLLSDHQVDLLTPMQAAIGRGDGEAVSQIIDHAVVEEIIRRLDGASKNLGDYQVAKVLVVKSKLFLDLVSPKLTPTQREQAQQAIVAVLASIGNPGVFGVGQAPADPEQFALQQQRLLQALSSLK
ncbi:hypothetical protein [uncultured Ferrimonas sp.]|uniref:hypothetical protein n=1 Tax=uncultured Ferrimonas sp. TaxID=432640 RepID=UPI00261E3FEA|nr:hypothetical protein [uncultured Ferrimonas sp.]